MVVPGLEKDYNDDLIVISFGSTGSPDVDGSAATPFSASC